jgi:hypothetical protein
MRFRLPTFIGVLAGVAAAIIGLDGASRAAVNQVVYPEVKVVIAPAYQPDTAFKKMRAAFTEAVAKHDAHALFALVGPTFVWTLQGVLTDQFDLGRDALHNFKVVFGFRMLGKDVDGGVDDGPYWDALAAFANDPTYYLATDAGNLVCGPIAAEVTDESAFDQARHTTGGQDVDWYFTLAETAVLKAPGDTGAPIAKVGTVAMPVVGVHSQSTQDQAAAEPDYFEVLLPSGKTGWVRSDSVRPLYPDRLCYAKTAADDWKIASIDQASQ